MPIYRPVGGASTFLRARGLIGGAAYVGPGDIVSGATAWYGLRGYSAAFAATGTGKAVNVRRASDNATMDIVILANGNLDITTANTFATVDATASASATASTTLNLTGVSSTPHVGSTITGAGVTQPCYVISVGSFTAGAGTVVVNQAQTLAAVSISIQYGLFVTEAYDQSGNGNHATQATAGNQPQLLPVAKNGLPGLLFNGTSQVLAAAITSVAQPLTQNVVFLPVSETSGANGLFSNGASAGNGPQTYFNASFSLLLFAGGSVSTGFTLTPGNNYAVLSVFQGNTSTAMLNGSITGSLSPSTSASGPSIGLGARAAGGNYCNYTYYEGGMWPSAISPPNQTLLTTNERTYWNF